MVQLLCKLCLEPVHHTAWKTHVTQKRHLQKLPFKIVVKGPFAPEKLDSIYTYFVGFGGIREHKIINGADETSLEFRFWDARVHSEIIHREHMIFDHEVEIFWYRKGLSGAMELVAPDSRMNREKVVYRNLALINEIKQSSTFLEQTALFEKKLDKLHEEMKTKRREVCRDLTTARSADFRPSGVQFFGSSATELFLHDSNLHIYLDNTDSQTLAGLLMNTSIFIDVSLIEGVIKCRHRRTQTCCQIMTQGQLVVGNSELIKFYLSLDEKLRPLALLIKFWVDCHCFRGEDVFTGYALCLMVIFYLQQPPYNLPSVRDLQRDLPPDEIEGWNCAFGPVEFASPALEKASIGELTTGFLKFYSQFDYLNRIISPFFGTEINIRSGVLKMHSGFCIQDPFEHSENVTAMSLSTAGKFTSLCRYSHRLLVSEEPSLYDLFTGITPSCSEFIFEKGGIHSRERWATLITRILKEICGCEVEETNSGANIVCSCKGEHNVFEGRLDTLDQHVERSFEREVLITERLLKDGGRKMTWGIIVTLKFQKGSSRVALQFEPQHENFELLSHIAHFIYVSVVNFFDIDLKNVNDGSSIIKEESTSEQAASKNRLVEKDISLEEGDTDQKTERSKGSTDTDQNKKDVPSVEIGTDEDTERNQELIGVAKHVALGSTDTDQNEKEPLAEIVTYQETEKNQELISVQNTDTDRKKNGNSVGPMNVERKNFDTDQNTKKNQQPNALDKIDIDQTQESRNVPNDQNIKKSIGGQRIIITEKTDTDQENRNCQRSLNVLNQKKQKNDAVLGKIHTDGKETMNVQKVTSENTDTDQKKKKGQESTKVLKDVPLNNIHPDQKRKKNPSEKNDADQKNVVGIKQKKKKKSKLKRFPKNAAVDNVNVQKESAEIGPSTASRSTGSVHASKRKIESPDGSSESKKLKVATAAVKEPTKENKNLDVNSQTKKSKVVPSTAANKPNGPSFREQVSSFCGRYLGDQNALARKRKMIHLDLLSTLRQKFTFKNIHFFGSSATGLSITNSSFNIYVNNLQPRCTEELIRSLSTKFSVCSHSSTTDLKLKHFLTGIGCHLHLKLDVRTPVILDYYLDLDHKLRPFFVLLKSWSDKRVLPNYALYLMVIFYLQQRPYNLPSVEQMQIQIPTNFRSPALAKVTIQELLVGFFTFYSQFDYFSFVIAPFFGAPIHKTRLCHPADLPFCYPKPKNTKSIHVDMSIFVQDPFEPSKNAAAEVTHSGVARFAAACRSALDTFRGVEKGLLQRWLLSGADLSQLCVFNMHRVKSLQHVKEAAVTVLTKLLCCKVEHLERKYEGEVVRAVGRRDVWDRRFEILKAGEKQLGAGGSLFDMDVYAAEVMMKDEMRAATWFVDVEMRYVENRKYVRVTVQTRKPELAHFLYSRMLMVLDGGDRQLGGVRSSFAPPYKVLVTGPFHSSNVAKVHEHFASYGNVSKRFVTGTTIEYNFAEPTVYLKVIQETHRGFDCKLKLIPLAPLRESLPFATFQDPRLAAIHQVVSLHTFDEQVKALRGNFKNSSVCVQIVKEIQNDIKAALPSSRVTPNLVLDHQHYDFNVDDLKDDRPSELIFESGKFCDVILLPEVISCIHVKTQSHCWIRTGGNESKQLLNHVLSLDSKLEAFFTVVYFWMGCYDFLGAHSFCSRSVQALIIFFLQQPPYGLSPSKDFSRTTLEAATLLDLVRGFFRFYGEFDYISNVVSVHSGVAVSKALSGLEALTSGICVQDFFQLSRNLTSSVPLDTAGRFANICRYSLHIMLGDERLFLYKMLLGCHIQNYSCPHFLIHKNKDQNLGEWTEAVKIHTRKLLREVLKCSVTETPKPGWQTTRYECEGQFDIWESRPQGDKLLDSKAGGIEREIEISTAVIREFPRKKLWRLTFDVIFHKGSNRAKVVFVKKSKRSEMFHLCHFLYTRLAQFSRVGESEPSKSASYPTVLIDLTEEPLQDSTEHVDLIVEEGETVPNHHEESPMEDCDVFIVEPEISTVVVDDSDSEFPTNLEEELSSQQCAERTEDTKTANREELPMEDCDVLIIEPEISTVVVDDSDSELSTNSEEELPESTDLKIVAKEETREAIAAVADVPDLKVATTALGRSSLQNCDERPAVIMSDKEITIIEIDESSTSSAEFLETTNLKCVAKEENQEAASNRKVSTSPLQNGTEGTDLKIVAKEETRQAVHASNLKVSTRGSQEESRESPVFEKEASITKSDDLDPPIVAKEDTQEANLKDTRYGQNESPLQHCNKSTDVLSVEKEASDESSPEFQEELPLQHCTRTTDRSIIEEETIEEAVTTTVENLDNKVPTNPQEEVTEEKGITEDTDEPDAIATDSEVPPQVKENPKTEDNIRVVTDLVVPNRKRKRSDLVEDDIPPDFFDDFSNEDFLDGLDLLETIDDNLEDLPLTTASKRARSRSRPRDRKDDGKMRRKIRDLHRETRNYRRSRSRTRSKKRESDSSRTRKLLKEIREKLDRVKPVTPPKPPATVQAYNSNFFIGTSVVTMPACALLPPVVTQQEAGTVEVKQSEVQETIPKDRPTRSDEPTSSKAKLLSRCNDIINMMTDRPNRRFSLRALKRTSKPTKYESPLKKTSMVRFGFTTPLKHLPGEDFLHPLNKILRRVGFVINRENTNVEDLADIVTKALRKFSAGNNKDAVKAVLAQTLLGGNCKRYGKVSVASQCDNEL